INPHMQTLVEPLHTIELGMVKYAWAHTCDQLAPNVKKKDDCILCHPIKGTPMSIVLQHLQGMNMEGWGTLEFEPEYICQYWGALNRKHFHTLVHCMPFVLWDLVSPDTLELWVILGLACAKIYKYNIKDKLKHEVKLIQALLHAFARANPDRMCGKAKPHLLMHLPDHVHLYGPVTLFTTQQFEQYNSIFWGSSVLSNHQSPSQHITSSSPIWSKFNTQLLADGFKIMKLSFGDKHLQKYWKRSLCRITGCMH
ncbi:hypothetical protein DACRYDRAFT_46591, partial [Dacryopinax primogenitus]